jgi:CubicO group peptidase (beta-lactamase class C family)
VPLPGSLFQNRWNQRVTSTYDGESKQHSNNGAEMSNNYNLNRRRFLELTGLATAGLLADNNFAWSRPGLDDAIAELLGEDFGAGMAAGLIDGYRVAWSGGFGWADVEKRIEMTPETCLNIASVCKTITATAVMQLWENGAIDLDGDVGRYVPFAVRNTRFPDVVITCRQLLTHRSSIKDGPAYGPAYVCGDPTISLADWISGYLQPGGAFYDDGNFHEWTPGTADPPESPRPYSNVGYGLLAYIVESVAGIPFPRYTAENIFDPLGMHDTSWYIGEIEPGRQAVPYSRITEDFELPDGFQDLESFLPASDSAADLVNGELYPHCLYNHPNYPDGMLRTNVTELSRFLMAILNGGRFERTRILEQATIDKMLSNDHFGRGLCWNSTRLGEEKDLVWYHNGLDHGVLTFMGYRPRDARGAIVLSNCDDPGRGFGGTIRHLFAMKDVG